MTAFYSGANVHHSSVALPLMQETSIRVNYFYDLQDAGYDADIIRGFSIQLGHRPIIDINPKNSQVLRDKIELIKNEKIKFKHLALMPSIEMKEDVHYNQRSMVERVNKYLKDDFGCNTIFYQGATKSSFCISIWNFICLYPTEFKTCDINQAKELKTYKFEPLNHKARSENDYFLEFQGK